MLAYEPQAGELTVKSILFLLNIILAVSVFAGLLAREELKDRLDEARAFEQRLQNKLDQAQMGSVKCGSNRLDSKLTI